ncbi:MULTISPECIES: erythromycin resistance leader peptide [Actinomycetes]
MLISGTASLRLRTNR